MADFLLQMQWDAALVKAWHGHGLMWPMSRLSKPDLLRTPINPYHFKMPVRAFVASYLPKLSSVLLSGKHADADVVMWLESSGLKTGSGSVRRNADVARSIGREKRWSKTHKRVDVHKGHRRSDWGVCK